MAKHWWMSEKDEKDVKDPKKEQEEIELKPGDVKAKLDKIDALETSLSELKAKAPIFDRMATFLDKQEKTNKDEEVKKRTERQQQTDEELEAEFLTDPANATKKLLRETMSPLVITQVNTAATLTMRDMFAEEPEYFEYAHDPTIRREVEAMVTQLPLADRTNKESIRNCYLVAEGRHKQEIKEGKIKARTSAVSGSGTGTGAPKADQEDVVILSESEKHAAKVFGLTEAEYAKSRKELSYV